MAADNNLFSFRDVSSLLNPQPQWNESNSSFMFSKDCDIELKAFINFYMLVLWPNDVRCMFNTIRIIGHLNYNMDKSKHTWNNDCFRDGDEEFILWFPKTIFPNGPHYDEDSKKLSMRYRAALDLLVVDFFQQKNMILHKTNDMGLCWYAYNDCLSSQPLLMETVAAQTKGLLFIR